MSTERPRDDVSDSFFSPPRLSGDRIEAGMIHQPIYVHMNDYVPDSIAG